MPHRTVYFQLFHLMPYVSDEHRRVIEVEQSFGDLANTSKFHHARDNPRIAISVLSKSPYAVPLY